ncbi:MAG: hypothetical protein ACFCUW_15625 [Kiloniellaceae bacterium]
MLIGSTRLLAMPLLTIGILAALITQLAAQSQSPEEVAHQAGSVKGTAAGCDIDTTQYVSRVKSLFDHMAGQGSSAAKLDEIFSQAAMESEHQQRSEPSVGCDNFRGMFGEFTINNPDWTPSQGWKPL